MPPQDFAGEESRKDATFRSTQVLKWSLRLFGTIDLLALIAVVMPVGGIYAGHVRTGMGSFPEGPLPLYLARSTSLVYAFHGAILWCLSQDVPRFLPVIQFVGAGTVVCGAVLLWIDLSTGMPGWWTAIEGPIFALSGAWLLWWCRQLSPVTQNANCGSHDTT